MASTQVKTHNLINGRYAYTASGGIAIHEVRNFTESICSGTNKIYVLGGVHGAEDNDNWNEIENKDNAFHICFDVKQCLINLLVSLLTTV